MYGSTILATLLGASTVFAAPTWPQLNTGLTSTVGRDVLTDYFKLLAQKIDLAKLATVAPTCNVSKAQMPTLSASPLPTPAAGLVVKHVAIGRGTQNYTCATADATTVPVAAGAVATLFDASCVASIYPDLLHALPKLALQFDLPTTNDKMGPTNLVVSGKHFFTNATTPFFNLDTSRKSIGEAPCSKLNASSAPTDAPKGRQGEVAVPWLRLSANPDATGGIHEVFRVETPAAAPLPRARASLPHSRYNTPPNIGSSLHREIK
ncbi:hypothetical protein E0Z10_g5355 [Xylaria hypoxylon]|uniref:Malate dehydrogenase n=1 Tax=Xylaria hypoxylon TaxID=37992 RepID=A0A4Z0YY45_9PEZI|nr:hypothetical protein E0Z10_g5355 [Xylaria hypoxylon]